MSEQDSNYDDNSCTDHEVGLNDEDIWDDSLLIQMYEASQKQINDELMKRFAVKTSGIVSEETNNANSNNVVTTDGACKKVKQKPTNHTKPNPKVTNSDRNKLNMNRNFTIWKEGDFCQLTYLEDNVDYEANIVSINQAEQTCLVRYIGYENEEIRSLADLKPSEGENVRKLQIEMSIQDGYGKPTDAPLDEQQNNAHGMQTSQDLLHSMPKIGGGTSRIIPPPPPFVNDSVNGTVGTNNATNQGDDDDVLASMLMSWYMTGYHTGYYQARKDFEK